MPTALLRSFYFGLKGTSSAEECPITGQHPRLKTAPQTERRRCPVCRAAASFCRPFCTGGREGARRNFAPCGRGAIPGQGASSPLFGCTLVSMDSCPDVPMFRRAAVSMGSYHGALCPGASVSAYLHLNVPSFQCAFVPVCACFGMGPTLPRPLLVQACHRHAPVLACFCSSAFLSWYAPTSMRPPFQCASVPAYSCLEVSSPQCVAAPMRACFSMDSAPKHLLPRCKPVTGMPLFWRASAWVHSSALACLYLDAPPFQYASVPAYSCLEVSSSQCIPVPTRACFSMDFTPDAPSAPVQAYHRHAPALACFCLGALLLWHAPISARPHSSAHLFWRIPISTRLRPGARLSWKAPILVVPLPRRAAPDAPLPQFASASMYPCLDALLSRRVRVPVCPFPLRAG